MIKKVLFSFLSISLFLFLCLFVIRKQIQDDNIPAAPDFRDQRIMFIFPHPDDEITSVGTLKSLDSQNIPTALLTFTRGEAGDHGGLVQETDPIRKKEKLGKIRYAELKAVGQLIGLDSQDILNFPDSGLQNIPADSIKKIILSKIYQFRPTILFSYDDKVGLYGHLDHRLIARYTKEVFTENVGKEAFPVRKLYQVTLPEPMIRLALKISKGFQQNYPKDASKGLPKPSFAVDIHDFGKFKRDAMLLHQSQKATFNDMQPYFDKISPEIYYRIFDKEYFSEVIIK